MPKLETKYTNCQWHLSGDKNKFSPRCRSDVLSRDTWYNNITRIDIQNHFNYRRKGLMRKYPDLSLREIDLLLLETPEGK
jgi:hypothetical protein